MNPKRPTVIAGTADVEPAFDLKGLALGSDPSGADAEAIIALPDGTFWVGDEYGPSLLRVGPDGYPNSPLPVR